MQQERDSEPASELHGIGGQEAFCRSAEDKKAGDATLLAEVPGEDPAAPFRTVLDACDSGQGDDTAGWLTMARRQRRRIVPNAVVARLGRDVWGDQEC